jgi:hypothetical protein
LFSPIGGRAVGNYEVVQSRICWFAAHQSMPVISGRSGMSSKNIPHSSRPAST